jgi:hypothetical protein
MSPQQGVISATFDVTLGSYEYSFITIIVLATRLSAVPSGKTMLVEEPLPVSTASFL